MFLTLSLVAGIAGPAAAQSAAELCTQLSNVTVGQWAEYRMTVPQMGNDPVQMRMAVVGTEAVNGKAHHWHELKMAGRQGTMIIQVLVPGYPYEVSDIAGMVMKAGDQPAMRMPDQMIGMMAQCDGATVVGNERVTVPAGAFETVHLRAGEGGTDVWVARDMPFGVIQMRAANGESMVLLGHGTDATSSITETPQEMGR
jgi:hypothetical protein